MGREIDGSKKREKKGREIGEKTEIFAPERKNNVGGDEMGGPPLVASHHLQWGAQSFKPHCLLITNLYCICSRYIRKQRATRIS